MTIIALQIVTSLVMISLFVWYVLRSQRSIETTKRNHELGAFLRATKRSIATLEGHPSEVAHLIGVMRAKPMRAPLTQRECIAWHVRIYARWPRGGEAEIAARSEVVDGTLADESGEILIDGHGARAVLASNPERVDQLSPEFLKIAQSVYSSDNSQELRYHAVETILFSGDRVALLGRIPEKSPDTYREGQGWRLVSRSDAELIVTDDIELLRK